MKTRLERAKTRVSVDSDWTQEIRLKLGCSKNLCCDFSIDMADVGTGLAMKNLLKDILYADHLVLIGESIDTLRNN